jgi:outer membrane protein OmpA-like peptidoglycan-associated protein/Tol biopolymer transport system component
MKHISLAILFCAVAATSSAQQYGDAQYKQNFNKADALIYEGSYLKALPIVEGLHMADSSIANINYMLGVCHLYGTKNLKRAIGLLETATRNVNKDYLEANWKEKKAPGITYLHLGRAYHLLNDFDQAVANYYNYRSFISPDDIETYNKVRMVIKHAENAPELLKKPVNVKITNLGPAINSAYPEYSPVISADGETLIFTSRRPGGVTDAKDKDGSYFDDIYVSKSQGGGAWGRPTLIGGGINTAGHEAAIGISPDGQTLFLYKDDNGDGNIYVSEFKNNSWTAPVKLGSDINTSSWETHATVSAEGDMLIFTSNRPGGYGGRDLWYSLRLPDGNWGLAQNMGSVINTQFEEESPFLAFDGKTLFFSSQGHTSMGGFDIFKTDYVDGAWTDPVNLGYPVNTSDDDVFFVLSADGRTAYYSSRMSGGFGETDLYKLRIDPQRTDAMAVARGEIIVPDSDYLGYKTVINVKNESGVVVGTYRPNRNTGYYVLLLEPDEKYEVIYEAGGFDPLIKKVNVSAKMAYNRSARPIDLERVVFGADIIAQQELKRKAEEVALKASAKAAEEERLAEESRQKAKKSEVEAANAKAIREAEEAERLLKEEFEKAEQLASKAMHDSSNNVSAQKGSDTALAGQRQQAEERAKQEAAAKAKAEEQAQIAAKEAERQQAEERAKQEAAAKAKAEEQAQMAAKEAERKQAEERAKQEAAAKAKAEEQAQMAAKEAERKQAEERAKQEAAAKAKAEEQAQMAAKEAERKQAEERAKQEAAAKAKAEEQAQMAAKEAERKQAEERAKQEAAAKAKAEEQAQMAAKEAERKQAEERAKQEAAAKAKAEEQAQIAAKEAERKQAEERARQEAQKQTQTEDSRANEEAMKREALAKRLEELRQQKITMEAELAEERAIALKALEQRQQEELEAQRAVENAMRLRMKMSEEEPIKQQRSPVVLSEGDTKRIADIEEVMKRNKQLMADNEELRAQLAETNAKLDEIIQGLREGVAPPVQQMATYENQDVPALQSGIQLILQNMLFDYNKARLRGNSERELDKLSDFLNEHPQIKILISGHTDAIGDAEYNLRLSRARAEAVMNYLIQKGISKNRLKAVGLGQSRPIARNDNQDGSDNPLGRQLNRRIEISILDGDASLIRTEEFSIPDDARLKP